MRSVGTVVFVCQHGLVPNGTVVEVWDDVPAGADGFQAAQAAIAGRLPSLIRG